MTKKKFTTFQGIVNYKGWTYTLLAERWNISVRQITRMAAQSKVRDIDAAYGLPFRK